MIDLNDALLTRRDALKALATLGLTALIPGRRVWALDRTMLPPPAAYHAVSYRIPATAGPDIAFAAGQYVMPHSYGVLPFGIRDYVTHPLGWEDKYCPGPEPDYAALWAAIAQMRPPDDRFTVLSTPMRDSWFPKAVDDAGLRPYTMGRAYKPRAA